LIVVGYRGAESSIMKSLLGEAGDLLSGRGSTGAISVAICIRMLKRFDSA
jgi:hypothetical protein